jgi:hypothetical protein
MIKGRPAEIQTSYVLNRKQAFTATFSVPERKLRENIKNVRVRTEDMLEGRWLKQCL